MVPGDGGGGGEVVLMGCRVRWGAVLAEHDALAYESRVARSQLEMLYTEAVPVRTAQHSTAGKRLWIGLRLPCGHALLALELNWC